MKTPFPSYEPGDRVICTLLVGFPAYAGKQAVIESPLGAHIGTTSAGFNRRVENTYKIRFADGVAAILCPEQLVPAPPANRSDLDRQVAWSTLPDEVVIAMHLGPKEDV